MMIWSKLRKRVILLLVFYLFILVSSPLFASFSSEISITPGGTFTTQLNSDQQFLGIIRITIYGKHEYNLSIFNTLNSIILTRVTNISLEVHFIGTGSYMVRMKNLSNETINAEISTYVKNLEETDDGHYVSADSNYSCWQLLINSEIQIISIKASTTGRYQPYVTMMNKGGEMFLYKTTVNPSQVPNWGLYAKNYTINNQRMFDDIAMEKNEKIWFLLRSSSDEEHQIVFTFVRTYFEKEGFGTIIILLVAAFFAFVTLSWNRARKRKGELSPIARKNKQKLEKEIVSKSLLDPFTLYSDVGKRKSRK